MTNITHKINPKNFKKMRKSSKKKKIEIYTKNSL